MKFSANSMNDAVFEYGQNSFIQANGNIVITEKGCYQTNLMAKNAMLFKKPSSVVRGGLLIAGKCIKMGIVGTPSGVSTSCRVTDEDGKILPELLLSIIFHVIISITGDLFT